MLCRRISTCSVWAICLALLSGRTLNPITTAFDATAKVISDSLIAPTPVWMIRTLTPSTSILANDIANASTEPCTSALMIMLRSFISPCFICSNNVSKDTAELAWRVVSIYCCWRFSPIWRAVFSSPNTTKRSPALGTSCKPVISTGVDGLAVWIFLLRSLIIARTRPNVLPTTSGSPTFRLPFCTSNVATAPRPLSSFASITVPKAKRFGLAFNSCISVTNKIFSNNSSIPSPLRAEIGTKIVSPPHSSEISPYSTNSFITLSGFAWGLSILFTATIIGTSAALAWLIASIVWGITPSSAATTKIVTSVILAPRARIVVKAAWPGVSKKVIFLSLARTW